MAQDERTPMPPDDASAPVRLPPEAMTSWMLSRGTADAARTAKHHLVEETRRLINAVTMLDINPRRHADIDPGRAAAAVHALTAAVAQVAGKVEALPRRPG